MKVLNKILFHIYKHQRVFINTFKSTNTWYMWWGKKIMPYSYDYHTGVELNTHTMVYHDIIINMKDMKHFLLEYFVMVLLEKANGL